MCQGTSHICFSKLSRIPCGLLLKLTVRIKMNSLSRKLSLPKGKKTSLSRSQMKAGEYRGAQYLLFGHTCTQLSTGRQVWTQISTKVISKPLWQGLAMDCLFRDCMQDTLEEI